ncbi:EamA family transporter [Candidatus Izimaplasma bacterium ZiA1]|uniref:EamA family transporter n=1 Tax=Candidatus Izimoplasma sp. ZiA1 TaxID=2024899 RepID=UPI000BAA6BA9|nr:EamA family transporter [Candidatus Izimaplasma bacterium ZiA1]
MSEKQKAIIAYILVCIIWGSTYLAIKVGVKDSPPLLFASIRFIIAGSILLIYGKIRGYHMPSFKNFLRLGVVGLLLLLGGNGFVMYAETTVDSGISSLIISTIPIFIFIIEVFVLKTTMVTKSTVFGLLLGFIGIYILINPSNIVDVDFVGGMYLIIASLLWSIGSVYSKTINSKSNMQVNIGVQMLIGGIGQLIVGVLLNEHQSITFTSNSIIALVYLIFIGSLIGYSSYIYLLSKWPATKVSTYAYINPIVAIILGNIFLSEKLSIVVFLSMGLIFIAVFIVQKSKISLKKN